MAFLAIWIGAKNPPKQNMIKPKTKPRSSPLQKIFCWKFRLWFWGALSWNEYPTPSSEISFMVDLAPGMLLSSWHLCGSRGWIQILWNHIFPNVMVDTEYFISCLRCWKLSSGQLKNCEEENMLSTVYIIRINFLYLLGPCIPFTFSLFLFFPSLQCLCMQMGIIFLPIYPCFSLLLTSDVLDLISDTRRAVGVVMYQCVCGVFFPACPYAFTSWVLFWPP